MAGTKPQGVTRRVARSVLAEILEDENLSELGEIDSDGVDVAISRLMIAAVKVTRANSRDHGEIVTLTFRVPPDGTEDEEA